MPRSQIIPDYLPTIGSGMVIDMSVGLRAYVVRPVPGEGDGPL